MLLGPATDEDQLPAGRGAGGVGVLRVTRRPVGCAVIHSGSCLHRPGRLSAPP